MTGEQKLISIEVADLMMKAQQMCSEKYRLVQIGCTKCPDSLQVNYSFDRDYNFVNLQISLPLDGALIPSISSIYWAALLYENEMQDLYGVTVKDIVLDYKGTFYRKIGRAHV